MYGHTARPAAAAALALALAAPLAAQQTVSLPARDVALKDRPANVFAVGTEEGRDWEMFSGIRAAAFDRSDNLYLLDGQNTRVLVFDARGRFVRQFGKKGGGPGEMQAPVSLDILADGNIVVSDLANRAFIIYTPTGEHVRNVTFDESLGFPIGGMYADARGGIVGRSMPRLRPDQPRPTENASPIFRQQLNDGGALTTLYKVPTPPPQTTESAGAGGARRVATIMMDPVFGPRPTFGVLPDGRIALHHETEYAIKLLDPNGRHTRTLTREFRPRKVTKKDQEEWQKRTRENGGRVSGPGAGATIAVTMGSGGGREAASVGSAPRNPEAMRMALENTPFAESMSVVTGIRTDPQGRIWVQRRHTDGTDVGPVDLIGADGRYIGTLPPQPLPNAVSASGLAAWVETDDLGVERVAVRRLPQSWR